MVELYCKLVRANKIAIDDVPIKFREKVRDKLTDEM